MDVVDTPTPAGIPTHGASWSHKEVARRNKPASQPKAHLSMNGGNGQQQDGIPDSFTHQIYLAERPDCFASLDIAAGIDIRSGRLITTAA